MDESFSHLLQLLLSQPPKTGHAGLERLVQQVDSVFDTPLCKFQDHESLISGLTTAFDPYINLFQSHCKAASSSW
jgi:hypothetical protein